jgi:hypothetical protein
MESLTTIRNVTICFSFTILHCNVQYSQTHTSNNTIWIITIKKASGIQIRNICLPSQFSRQLLNSCIHIPKHAVSHFQNFLLKHHHVNESILASVHVTTSLTPWRRTNFPPPPLMTSYRRHSSPKANVFCVSIYRLALKMWTLWLICVSWLCCMCSLLMLDLSSFCVSFLLRSFKKSVSSTNLQ